MMPDPTPLTPEERALAERLARLGPHGEPSPALDARILAAAHAATQAPARAPRHRRWPVALGVAASLVLALGIAWRMRPPEVTPAHPTEAASATRAIAIIPTPSAAATQPSPAGPATAAPDQPTAQPRPFSVEAPLPPPPIAAKASAPPTVAPVATAPDLAPPPAAPAMVAAPLPAQSASEERTMDAQVLDKSEAAGQRAATRSDNAAAEAEAASAGAEAQQAGAPESDEPSDEVPPATADSPEVREAWLQRIRELRDGGYTDEARASLHEFVRRHPDAPLPDDLRALRDE
jgi:hypothetical protein